MPLSKIQGIEGQVTPNLGRRNLIINGAMQVAQRGTSSTGIGASGGYFTCDRMYVDFSSTAGRLTQSQVAVTDLPGFANALKLDCTTADTSVAAGEIALLQYRIEGQDLQQFKKGTADAEKMTVSFYVKGNGNATYICELYDNDNGRQISQTFSVTSSWNRVVLTYDGDTTGAFDDDGNLSLYILFWLHSGSNYNSGTLSTTWTAQTPANRAVGGSSFFSSTDNEFFITGLQMEVGDTATEFEHRSFAEELALCHRYFYRWSADGETYSNLCIGGCISGSNARGVVQMPQTMRSDPAATYSGSFRIVSMGSGNVRSSVAVSISRGHPFVPYVQFSGSGGSSLTGGQAAEMGANNDNDAYIDFNAEL